MTVFLQAMPYGGFRELRQWMQDHKVGIRGFSALSGINRTSVHRLVHGRTRTCSVRLARAIMVATKGEIGIAEIEAYEARMALKHQVVIPKKDHLETV